MQPLWYRTAVIYEADVALFLDSNGDGWGDLRGMTERLEYVRGLGANALWLQPFYPSPWLDGGYDLTDHLSIDERFGDLADFAELLEKADELGIRVIIELVAQHTSDQHRWFREARADRDSPYRDYYIWSDEPVETDVEPIFPTEEDSVWEWDDEAGQYYRHIFYKHEPDLNTANPSVRREIQRIMAFWLRMGISGFRVDAAPYMVKRAREADDRDDGQWILREMRSFLELRHPYAVLLGEVDVPVEQYAEYFGDGHGLNMLLDFWLNNHLFLALARGDAEPLRRAIEEQPPPTANSQYANWLRNHDELDLERLTEDERNEVIDVFAPNESMRAYGRGIRRRLAPMLDGDERRLAMTHALLFSLPGTPVLLYGDEIGMGDNLEQAERLAVRAPMQWTDAPDAGFSTAPPNLLNAPLIDDGQYGYEQINVSEQTLRRDSLLAKVTNMVRTRLGLREIGLGSTTVIKLEGDAASVLALRHDLEDMTSVTFVNLGPDEVAFRIRDDDLDDLVDLLADEQYPSNGEHGPGLTLNGYGYRWMRPRQRLFG